MDLHFGGSDALADGPAANLASFDVRDALHFPGRCARILDEAVRGERLRGLDVGCAVGGAATALAASSKFAEVVGVAVQLMNGLMRDFPGLIAASALPGVADRGMLAFHGLHAS